VVQIPSPPVLSRTSSWATATRWWDLNETSRPQRSEHVWASFKSHPHRFRDHCDQHRQEPESEDGTWDSKTELTRNRKDARVVHFPSPPLRSTSLGIDTTRFARDQSLTGPSAGPVDRRRRSTQSYLRSQGAQWPTATPSSRRVGPPGKLASSQSWPRPGSGLEHAHRHRGDPTVDYW